MEVVAEAQDLTGFGAAGLPADSVDPQSQVRKNVEKGVLTQLRLNGIADDLADKGAKRNAPPLALIRAAETRVKVAIAITSYHRCPSLA